MSFELSPGIIAAYDQRAAALNKALDDCVAGHIANVAAVGREASVFSLVAEACELIGIALEDNSSAAVAAEMLAMAIDRLSRVGE